MSDEKWEKMEDWEIKTYKRISELEKHDEQLREIVRKWNQEILDNRRHISELEKKGEIRGSGMNQLTKAYKEHTNEIAELKEHDIFKIWKSVRKGGKTTLTSILNLNQGLTELKDSIRANEKICDLGYQECITHFNTLFEKYDNIEEVLRKIIDSYYRHPYNEEIKAMLDSGGDSIRGLVESNVCIHGNYLNDPCPECKPREDNKYFERKCIGCSDNFRGGVHAFMCGPCAFNLLNDGIIVKREDLQWLVSNSNSLLWNNKRFKRIKEEYKL